MAGIATAEGIDTAGAFFEHRLRTVLWVERKLADEVLPQLAMQLQAQGLRRGVEKHLEETEGHVHALERVFELLNLTPEAEPNEALEGLRREHDEGMKRVPGPGRLADLLHAAAITATEHLEIAMYDALIEQAETMREPLVANTLRGVLEEEERALDTARLGRRALLRDGAAASRPV